MAIGGRKMKSSIVIGFFIAVLAGCASPEWKPSARQQEQNRHLQALSDASEKTIVDSSDGISEIEAYKIAHDYFSGRGFTPCGMVDLPKDEGGLWRVPLLEGILPGPTMDVVIDKKSGSYRVEDVRKRQPIQRATDNDGAAPPRV
jgi:hypothetical protein